MLVKTKAIVISSLKFQEKSLIVKCFTLSDGLKSYFVRDAFSSRKGNQKIAYFQPLTVVEIEAIHKNKGTLEQIKEIKIDSPFQTIHSNIVKSTLTLFLSEMLHHSIHEEEKNEALFHFIESALHWFDHHDEIANFHLIFLLEITKYLGFYPDITEAQLPYFEMKDGVFAPFHSLTSLNQNETQLFKKLIDLEFDNNQKIFHVSERQIVLRILIDYYSMHLDGFKKPKSLEVLKEVFSP
ncbi:MAG: DNA repair protein RecO [Flavobacterium sp.]|nr:DNA repair protein RecO [Flavobacterium sp.]